MSDMETDPSFSKFYPPLPDYVNESISKYSKENDKRRKQKDPKRKAVEPPPEVTESDKCRRHKEIQKRIKMTNGRLSFLEHCIRNNVNGFVSPKKTAKKLKLSDPIAGTSQPVSVQNKFSRLSEKDAEITPTTSNQTAAPISARPKVPPIMFKHKKANYKQIVKNLNKDFPDCDVKLAGKYLKIFCKSPDEHRIVTEYLKEKSEEFYVIDPPDSRPLKIVIKGLPISTEIGEIHEDLTSQGFCVEKVAQLTRSKTKSPLPIFMVELERKPDSPDIFKMKKCCYLTVQEDITDRHGRSHPLQCSTSRKDRQIVRMAATDRSVTSRNVAQHIESVTHHSVSARTIRRRLQQSGLSARRPLLGLPLTQNHRRLRCQ
ncbi:transposable element Tcb1 transposase [Trichonephila clavipes]|nr:transposable element Tcb1 transposase [Trichonephila clavipes]